MTVSSRDFFNAMNELMQVINDPVFGLKVVLIVLTVMIAIAVAAWTFQKLMPLVIRWSSSEKRKNDEYAPFDEKPKAQMIEEIYETVIGDDGELIERKAKR